MNLRSVGAVGVLAACIGCSSPVETNNAALGRLFEEYYEFLLRSSPELATDVGRRDYNDRWTDYCLDAIAAREAADREALASLHAIDRDAL